MGTPDKNGVPYEQQLIQAEKGLNKLNKKDGGNRPIPIDLKDFRECAKEMSQSRLWCLFWDVRAGLCGDTPLSSVEIKAYFDLMEEERTVGKVRLLKIMDRAYLQARLG